MHELLKVLALLALEAAAAAVGAGPGTLVLLAVAIALVAWAPELDRFAGRDQMDAIAEPEWKKLTEQEQQELKRLLIAGRLPSNTYFGCIEGKTPFAHHTFTGDFEINQNFAPWLRSKFDTLENKRSPLTLAAYALGSLLLVVCAVMVYRGRSTSPPVGVPLAIANQPLPTTPAAAPLPPLTATIDCVPKSIPRKVKAGDFIDVVFLHPKWRNQLVRSEIVADGMWPKPGPPEYAYQCRFINDSEAPLRAVVLYLAITYESPKAEVRGRTAEIVLPESLELGKPYELAFVDDSGWTPTARLPEKLKGTAAGESVPRDVSVTYATQNGTPIELKGFGKP